MTINVLPDRGMRTVLYCLAAKFTPHAQHIPVQAQSVRIGSMQGLGHTCSNRPAPDRATRIGSAHNFSVRHCALRSDTPTNKIPTSSGLSESCTKIGDVPKSPVPTLAALVPSVGT